MNWISSLSDEGAKSRRSGRCGGTTLKADTSGKAAIRNENMFEVLMEATKYCSLGQLTAAMFEVGGAVQEEHVGCLGVPARRLAVALSASSPRRITGCGLSAAIAHAKIRGSDHIFPI